VSYFRFPSSPAPALDVHSLFTRLKANPPPFLLDVREAEEFSAAHLAGAVLISLGNLASRLEELPPESQIICICARGNRSDAAAKMLLRAGFAALNLRGGMFAWQEAGYPTETPC